MGLRVLHEDREVRVRGEASVIRLTLRWSGRVGDKVPSSDRGVRAAQLKR